MLLHEPLFKILWHPPSHLRYEPMSLQSLIWSPIIFSSSPYVIPFAPFAGLCDFSNVVGILPSQCLFIDVIFSGIIFTQLSTLLTSSSPWKFHSTTIFMKIHLVTLFKIIMCCATLLLFLSQHPCSFNRSNSHLLKHHIMHLFIFNYLSI